MPSIQSSNFYSAYKEVRNYFRKFDGLSTLEHAFTFLHLDIPDRHKEISHKLPWQVMLLIKWLLQDEHFNHPRRKRITSSEFVKLINKVKEIGKKDIFQIEKPSAQILLRTFPYQQFFYQVDFNIKTFARQAILFQDLPENHYLKTTFKKTTNLFIKEFLELSYYVVVHQINRNSPFDRSYFSSLDNIYGKEIIDSYLESISLNIDDAVLFAKENTTLKPYEYYEQTPFTQKPLLLINGKYYSYYPSILYSCIENFVYYSIRSHDVELFMTKFGTLFERYVERLIKYACIEYIDENYLKSELTKSSKVVDFLVTEEGETILIDAKGVELNYLGKVSFDSELIERSVRTSVIKGIEQAYSMVSNLNKQRSGLIASDPDNIYLIIVTYKEINIGTGKDFYDNIDSHFIDKLVSEYQGQFIIPLRNMYFISISTFEFWIELIKKGESSLLKGLKKARTDDTDPYTMKFNFTTHVQSWSDTLQSPAFLTERFSSIVEKAENNLGT